MKNKLSVSQLSRWVFAPLLLGSLIAWGVSPAYPGNQSRASVVPVQMAVSAVDETNTLAEMREIKARMQELESRERQDYALVLEGQRKTMDWWFSFLAVLTAIMAIFGGLIPYLMARKDKELIEQDKEQIKQRLAEIEAMKVDAANHVDKIHQDAAEVVKAKEDLKGYQSGAMTENKVKIQQTIETVQKDKADDTELGLRAAAIAASEANEAEKAYDLWKALTRLNQSDESAQFNAGYWAGLLGENTQGNEQLHWLKLVQLHSEQALNIKPDKHEAANNWGSALNMEAQALAASDLTAARSLWQRAGERYQQALDINPDLHDVANNWGNALLHEASAIAPSDAAQSNALLNQAEQLLLAHVGAAPGLVSYNLACVYGLRGDVQQCLHWLNVCQAHGKLPDCAHLREDKDLDAVRESPEFIEWLATVCGDAAR